MEMLSDEDKQLAKLPGHRDINLKKWQTLEKDRST